MTFSKVGMEAMLVMISALNTFNTISFHGSYEKKINFVCMIIFDFLLTRQRVNGHFKESPKSPATPKSGMLISR